MKRLWQNERGVSIATRVVVMVVLLAAISGGIIFHRHRQPYHQGL